MAARSCGIERRSLAGSSDVVLEEVGCAGSLGQSQRGGFERGEKIMSGSNAGGVTAGLGCSETAVFVAAWSRDTCARRRASLSVSVHGPLGCLHTELKAEMEALLLPRLGPAAEKCLKLGHATGHSTVTRPWAPSGKVSSCVSQCRLGSIILQARRPFGRWASPAPALFTLRQHTTLQPRIALLGVPSIVELGAFRPNCIA